MEALLTGLLAGYGIAIPVGAISVLIVESGLRNGFAQSFAAGAGAATADLMYASLAVIGGVALSETVNSVGDEFRVASAVLLILIAVRGLLRIRSGPAQFVKRSGPNIGELGRTYVRFVGLTIINPTTIIYFAAVIIGLGIAEEFSATEGFLFAGGAFLASLSWQTLLAGVGSFAGQRLGPTARAVAAILGNSLVLTFAAVILLQS